MWKKLKLIMLPTEKIMENRVGYYVEGLSLFESKHPNGKKSLSIERSMNGMNIANPQYLYIISDENIKEGDWYYTPSKRSIEQCVKKILIIKDSINDIKQLKIIASTDSSLSIPLMSVKWVQLDFSNNAKPKDLTEPTVIESKTLPTLSKEFISLYIEEYNKGNVIEEVEVEYYPADEEWNDNTGSYEIAEALKLNSNNEISIKLIKESWNREEVVKLIERSIDRGIHLRSTLVKIHKKDHIDKWIKENL